MMLMRLTKIQATIFALATFGYHIPMANAQQSCAALYQSSSKDMTKFDPELATTASEVKHVQDGGLDPNRYIVEFEKQYVLLTAKFHAQAEEAALQLDPPAGDTSHCKPALMPYLKMAELKMIYEHYGLGALLPPEMASTDYLKVVQSGSIPNDSPAFMPTAKQDSMKDMAIGGEIAQMIQKPWCIFGSCSPQSPFTK